jgi:hypothetical protein
MQDSVSMETSSRFMNRFFLELLRDGQTDRAMSVARGEVRGADDYWMPVLFLRLRNGRIWYVPGFDRDREGFEQWQSICTFVQQGKCVPIVGPDVAEHVFGGSRALAASLAQANQFPLQMHDSSDLAKVSQFIATQHGPEFVREKVIDGMLAEMQRAGENIVGAEARTMDTAALLDAIIERLAGSPADPLKIVAGLNARIFVNASNDSLLERFLERAPAAGGGFKKPIPLVTEWRDECRDEQTKPEFPGEASAKQPYVYYVFGKSQQESSWVLTEDDFFDYLIRTTRYQLMPAVVSDALLTGSLLFLGFPLEDWKFRILFRLILAKGGERLMQRFNHVGVQLDPGETTMANARRAKKYLERYFQRSKIDIYWGTSADFLRELQEHLDRMPPLATNPEKRRRVI